MFSSFINKFIMHKEGVNLELDNCDSLQINIIKLKKHF